MKKIYIAPQVETYKIRTADGILLTASADNKSILGNGGDTTSGSVTDADTKGSGDWNIWE